MYLDKATGRAVSRRRFMAGSHVGLARLLVAIGRKDFALLAACGRPALGGSLPCLHGVLSVGGWRAGLAPSQFDRASLLCATVGS